jgi:hypothetical protein
MAILYKSLRKIMIKKILLFGLGICLGQLVAFAQPDRWQQRVKYAMNVVMDVADEPVYGQPDPDYTNNSPDTLFKGLLSFVLECFQPGSMMDNRSRELGKIVYSTGRRGMEQDWDPRVRDPDPEPEAG